MLWRERVLRTLLQSVETWCSPWSTEIPPKRTEADDATNSFRSGPNPPCVERDADKASRCDILSDAEEADFEDARSYARADGDCTGESGADAPGPEGVDPESEDDGGCGEVVDDSGEDEDAP
jgi:hypothetical protein